MSDEKLNDCQTTTEYWDCDCLDDYIHHRTRDMCPHCVVYRDDQPDSRINEVKEKGLPVNE
jgi:hypothetical protein